MVYQRILEILISQVTLRKSDTKDVGSESKMCLLITPVTVITIRAGSRGFKDERIRAECRPTTGPN